MKKFIIKFVFILLFVFIFSYIINLVLLDGVFKYHGFGSKADILCIGHSHTELGIDSEQLEKELGVKVAKFAVPGASAQDRLAMLSYYYSTEIQPAKIIVYDIDPELFFNPDKASKSYKGLYPYMHDSGVQEYLKQKSDEFDNYDDYYLRKYFVLTRWNSKALSHVFRGYLNKRESIKGGSFDVNAVIMSSRIEYDIDDDSLYLLEKTIDLVTSNGSVLVMLYIPVVNRVFGTARQNDKLFELLKNYSVQSDNSVKFLDFGKKFESKHELFVDPTHLNRKGQVIFTSELSPYLKKFVVPTP